MMHQSGDSIIWYWLFIGEAQLLQRKGRAKIVSRAARPSTRGGTVYCAALGLMAVMGVLLAGCENKKIQPEVFAHPPFKTLTDSIEADKENDTLYFKRAILLVKNNETQWAIADLKQAWQLNPAADYAVALNSLLMESKPTEALSIMQKAVKDNPENDLLNYTLAENYFKTNKPDTALILCSSYLKKHPTDVNHLQLSADILEQKAAYDSLTIVLEKIAVLAPGNVSILYRLGYCYAENKNPKALALCNRLLQTDSLKNQSEPYYIKGIYFANIKNNGEALKAFDKTIELDYNNLNAHIEKGKIYFNQKKYAEAKKCFELANKIDPAYADAYYWLGMNDEKTGNKTNAMLNYEKAFLLDKTFTEAKDALMQLKTKK